MADEFPANYHTPAIAAYDGSTDPEEHLLCFEYAALLHRYMDGIKCQVFMTTFAMVAQQQPIFLNQFASSRKLWKMELNLFAVDSTWQPLEVPSTTQEVKVSAFSHGLLDGDFFKSLAKNPVSKFDAHLARAAKYINMKDAQAAKRESRGEKRKEAREEAPIKKQRTEFREKKVLFHRIQAVYIPLAVPITQALMAVKGKCLLTHPR
ncbi:UNVERIFIED_CONTAM: hypothetical protein Sindi_1313600 [Sesamum indicum]